MKYSIIYKPVI